MSARDLPHGKEPPCPFHTHTLNGWDAAYQHHEEKEDRARRAAHLSGACCTHRRPTRDGNPLTEETQP